MLYGESVMAYNHGKIDRIEHPPIPIALGNGRTVYRERGSNCNTAAIGPAGDDQIYSLLLSNLTLHANCSCSIVVNDQKGRLYKQTHESFKKLGYRVLKFDLLHPGFQDLETVLFNPFCQLKTREDAVRLADLLLPEQELSDPFLLQEARTLAVCLMEVVMANKDRDERREFNFDFFFAALRAVGREPGEKDDIDRVIEKNQEEGMKYKSMTDYRMLKQCSPSAWANIVAALENCIQRYNTPDQQTMMRHGVPAFFLFASNETIFYVINDKADSTKAPLLRLLYGYIYRDVAQFSEICGRRMLPIHLRFLLDDFASAILPADLEQILADCPLRNISYLLCFRDIARIRELYGESAERILNSMEYRVDCSAPLTESASCSQSR